MTRRRRPILILVFMLVGLATLWALFEHVHGKRMLRTYKAGLVSGGEKLTVEELIPPFSADANLAANHLVQAAWQLSQNGPVMPMNPPPAMRFVAPGKAMVGWRQPDIRDGGGRTNRWEDLDEQFRDNQRALAEMRAALDGTRFNWNLNYKQGYSILLPHLAKLKLCAQWLSAATVHHFHQEDLEGAQTDLKSLLSLADALRDERLAISQLVRLAIAAIAAGATWEALQADGWTDAQLASLQKRWESLEFAGPMGKTIEMERAMEVELFDRLRRSRDERKQFFDAMATGGPGGTGQAAAPGGLDDFEFALALAKKSIDSASSFGRESLWCSFWSYEDERRCLLGDQASITALREAARKHTFGQVPVSENEKLFRFHTREPLRQKYFLWASREGIWDRSIRRVRLVETHRELVVTAIALKRYQLRHTKTAPDLTALVPEFLGRLPSDWMDGKTLRYRVNPDTSFVLYSVNENGKDDGGDATPENPQSRNFSEGRDMVWPMPATADEVAAANAKATNARYGPGPNLMLERYGLAPKGNSK